MGEVIGVVAQVFPDQLTTNLFSQNVFYLVATAAVLLAIGSLVLVDCGLVRRKNVLDTFVQKLTAALIGGFSFSIVGYAIWQWQFNSALGIPNPLGQAIEDWWLGGTFLTQYSTAIDPAVLPSADVVQIFLPFNIAYAAVVCAFIHSIGLERMKASATYIISAVVGGVLFPIVLYLTWGSASPLTNSGVKDFVGVFPLYAFVAVFGLILVWRLGPRIGSFTNDPRVVPVPHHLGLTGAGVGLFLFAVPLFAMGCGYWVPGEGYFGISMASSGFGITLTNVLVAFAAGGIGGAIVAYKTRNLVIGMVGSIAGYIATATALDAMWPWQVAIVAFFASVPVYLVYKWMVESERLDEGKIIPLTLGAGFYGIVATSFFMWANETEVGGYFGITDGEYAFQNAEVTPWWQLIGLAATSAIAAIGAFVTIGIVERTVGLRVDEPTEVEGLDLAYWDAAGVTTGNEPGQLTVEDMLADARAAEVGRGETSPGPRPGG